MVLSPPPVADAGVTIMVMKIKTWSIVIRPGVRPFPRSSSLVVPCGSFQYCLFTTFSLIFDIWIKLFITPLRSRQWFNDCKKSEKFNKTAFEQNYLSSLPTMPAFLSCDDPTSTRITRTATAPTTVRRQNCYNNSDNNKKQTFGYIFSKRSAGGNFWKCNSRRSR